jgi:succinate-semialdehyde dehydrogenase/glutarate-semialdehyde dehydrogenase
MNIETRNPATGILIKSYDEMPSATVDALINSVHDAFINWQSVGFSARSLLMHRVADLLVERKIEYGKIITEEMGKPISASSAEVEKCAWVCRYYADNAESLLAPKIIKTDMKKSYVSYQAQGILFAIMPWNYPFWQIFRFAAPNLMAGQACLLKHAPISTGASLAIEALFKEAGFPDNLFRSLIIDTPMAEQVINHPHVTGVTLTGSDRAGATVGKLAGQAVKKVVLELGGSDPYLILEDADLELAATQSVASRLNNSGQVCIAAKRIIVADKIYEAFKAKVLEKAGTYTMGDPMEPSTQLGPLSRQDIRDKVHQQVQASVNCGAELLLGGEPPDNTGFYYPPTVLANVTPGMPAFDEEIFGPVITLIRAESEEEAIKMANQTCYGLSAAVFTKDLERGEYIALNRIKTGTCAVNSLVRSDPRLPFGGIKRSGYGRELGENGLLAFLNTKTIMIA